jgi:hypothetical protein
MPLQVRPCYPEHLFYLLYCARPAWSVISLPAINKNAPSCLTFMSASYKS